MELTFSFLKKNKLPRSRKNYNSLALPKIKLNKIGQMKIQQMAFMLVAVFIFFSLVAIFFIKIQLSGLKGDAANLERDQVISSLNVIADMPEFNCGSSQTLCLDEDKLRVMSGEIGKDYREFWPVASIRVYKVYPVIEEIIECPNNNCNYYEIYDNGQKNSKEFSTFVSICKRLREESYTYDRCEIGKLVVGMKISGGNS